MTGCFFYMSAPLTSKKAVQTRHNRKIIKCRDLNHYRACGSLRSVEREKSAKVGGISKFLSVITGLVSVIGSDEVLIGFY